MDRFLDGQSILGGAPFNVAWNLQGFGLAPRFVSAVGDDQDGRLIAEKMRAWGLSTESLQIVDFPTGEVRVTLADGQPSYEIVTDRAYDFIDPPDIDDIEKSFGLLYSGTLAFRSQRSRETIRELIGSSGLPRFIDINIRQPWFDHNWLPDLVGDAHWVKLNDEELSSLTKLPCDTTEGIETAVRRFRDQYGGHQFFVTCGSRGAHAITDDESLFADAPPPKQIKDTVGAGDAFAATTIYGLLSDWTLQHTLEVAVRFASRVCEMTGATSEDKTVYEIVNSG